MTTTVQCVKMNALMIYGTRLVQTYANIEGLLKTPSYVTY